MWHGMLARAALPTPPAFPARKISSTGIFVIDCNLTQLGMMARTKQGVTEAAKAKANAAARAAAKAQDAEKHDKTRKRKRTPEKDDDEDDEEVEDNEEDEEEDEEELWLVASVNQAGFKRD